MNDAPRPRFFVVGLFIVVVASYFASRTLENDVASIWPTILFVPGFLLVLGGQAWFVGAFLEAPEVGPVGLLMIGLFGVLPGLVIVSQTWGTEYDVMKWTGAVDLALVLGVIVLALVGPFLAPLVPRKWRDAREQRAREEVERAKRKLPG